MSQQTRNQSHEADYQIELIATGLAAQAPGALARWQDAFLAARDGWQLDRAAVLLRMLKSQPLDARDLGVVRYLEGTMMTKQGDWPAAAAAYQRALALHRTAGSVSGQVAALNGLANVLRRLDRPLAEIASLYQGSLALATELPDSATRAGILNGLGLTLYGQGQLDAAAGHFAEALEIAHTLGDRETEAAVLHNLGSLAWTRGQLAQAAERFSASAAIEETLGDAHGLAETINSLGLVAEARGEWTTAAGYYERSLAAFQATADLYGQVQAFTNLGNVAWLLGNHQQGLNTHQEALALARDLGDAHLEGQVLTSLGDARSALGLHDEAETAYREALVRKQTAGDQRSLKHTWFNLAGLYLTLRRYAEAESAYREALTLAHGQEDTRIEAFTWLGLAKLAALREEWEEARTHLDAAWPIAERADYPDCQAWICQLRGDLERLAARPDSELILRHYAEACAYAASFNERTLVRVLDYLVAVWSAHAEDGYPDQTIWFCDSMIAIWAELGYADPIPALPALFNEAASDLDDLLLRATTVAASFSTRRFAITALSYRRVVRPAVLPALLALAGDTDPVQADVIAAAGRFYRLDPALGGALPAELVAALCGRSSAAAYVAVRLLQALGTSAAAASAPGVRRQIVAALSAALHDPASRREVWLMKGNSIEQEGTLDQHLYTALLQVAGLAG